MEIKLQIFLISALHEDESSEQSSDLLLAFASTVILGFGTHEQISVRSKTTYVLKRGLPRGRA
jgi:hypothetical protein